MEVVCQCDYQDIYRIKDGVLLIVNKFKYIVDAEGFRYAHVFNVNKTNSRIYANGCQKHLKVLTKDINIQIQEQKELSQLAQ